MNSVGPTRSSDGRESGDSYSIVGERARTEGRTDVNERLEASAWAIEQPQTRRSEPGDPPGDVTDRGTRCVLWTWNISAGRTEGRER